MKTSFFLLLLKLIIKIAINYIINHNIRVKFILKK